jgi:magnesium transporter
MRKETTMNIKNYFAPKSMVYTGVHTDIGTKITHYQINEKNIKITTDFKQLENRKDYIQIVGLSDVEKIQSIRDHFAIDSLILEDIFNVRQRNKIELKENYLFAVFHVAYLDGGIVKDDYMSMLLYQDTLVSFHEKEPLFLAALPQFIESHADVKNRSIDYLFYAILDIITDHHLDVLDLIDQQTTSFEEELLEAKNVSQDAFYLIRKHLLKLKSSVTPILEQLTRVMALNSPLFGIANAPFYDDLIDHLSRLDQHLNQTRDLQRNLLDLHMNNQSTKMNRIITTLTLFSAIFIPLSFLAGFFGMNFVHFPILQYEHALAIFIGLCMILAGLMLLLFKKMKWF